MQLELGPVSFQFLEDGKLRVTFSQPNPATQGINISQTGQEKLVDYILLGYKENLHKSATPSPNIDAIWKKIETAMDSGFKPRHVNGLPNEAVAAMQKTEDDFRKVCLEAATKELQAGNIANAAKCVEMYETI